MPIDERGFEAAGRKRPFSRPVLGLSDHFVDALFEVVRYHCKRYAPPISPFFSFLSSHGYQKKKKKKNTVAIFLKRHPIWRLRVSITDLEYLIKDVTCFNGEILMDQRRTFVSAISLLRYWKVSRNL